MASSTPAVGYIRVSTGRRVEGLSLDVQRQRVEAFAELYGLDLVDVIADVEVSGASLSREGLDRALGLLEARQAEALVVARLDRLTRSVADLVRLVEAFTAAGWGLLSVGESIDTRSAAGRLVLNMLASVAQWEREVIAERTSAALRQKQARGEFIGGGTPYGWRLADGDLVAVDDEQRIIRQARELRAGGLSLRAVAAALEGLGMVSRAGRRFEAGQIRRIVR